MEILLVLIIGVVTFGVCFLVDKGVAGIFRNKAQYRSGLSVRLNQHYGGAGLILALVGGIFLLRFAGSNVMLLICGGFVVLLGIALVVYYLSFGIYYDEDSFVYSAFGKKAVTCSFDAIQGQKLYQLSAKNIMVELYLQDGKTISVQSNMKGAYSFLDAAFAGWCRQKGLEAEDCPFHDAGNCRWFPEMEES